MSDIFTKEKRSWIMSRIRSTETKTENKLVFQLKMNRIKFKRYPKIFGSPDFLIGKNVAVFIDGCFWHKCPTHYRAPKNSKKFWSLKIERNVQRDNVVNSTLKKEGYKVIRFWEHDIENKMERCIKKLMLS